MTRLTGGCQCGAVRFAAEGIKRTSICHCRMCQKAFGSAFGPFAVMEKVVWTRGQPKHFQSSNMVRRGFCAECGTPLTYEYGEDIDLALGAFDDPSAVPPQHQLAPEMAVGWFHGIERLPLRTAAPSAADLAHQAAMISFQHPDHDTADWPPKDRP